jgi:hypothetical protein
MTSRFALVGLGIIGFLALGAPAHAFIEKVIQQRSPGDIDPKMLQGLGGEQKRFLTAAQLRCTMTIQGRPYTIRFVFSDPSGKEPFYQIEDGESDIKTGKILRDSAQGGERSFTAKGAETEIDFAVKANGGIYAAEARRAGERRDVKIEGSCQVASGETAEPRRESTPSAPKPAPRGTRAGLLTAAQLSCTLNHGDHDHKIVVVFRNGRSFFYEPARTGRDGFTGSVSGDRANDEARRFTVAFKDGLEIDYTLASDGRLTATEARRDGRTGTSSLHGTCQIDSESTGG